MWATSKRLAWWLLAFLASPFVVWMSDEKCEELLKRATLGTPVNGLLGGIDDDDDQSTAVDEHEHNEWL